MKFSPCLIAAFVGSNQRNNVSFQRNVGETSRTSSSTALSLLPFANVVTEDLISFTSPKTTTTTSCQLERRQQEQQQSYQPRQKSIMENGVLSWIQNNLLVPPANAATTTATSAAPAPPTKEEIVLLRQAFAAFYGVDRNLEQAQQFFSEAIDSWQRQGPDERAGLYRVRGDVYMVRDDDERKTDVFVGGVVVLSL
jgi:hypothetical protein